MLADHQRWEGGSWERRSARSRRCCPTLPKTRRFLTLWAAAAATTSRRRRRARGRRAHHARNGTLGDTGGSQRTMIKRQLEVAELRSAGSSANSRFGKHWPRPIHPSGRALSDGADFDGPLAWSRPQALVALTPGRPPKRAFASKVRTMRSSCSACAAMIRSCAPRGVPVRRACAISLA